MTHPNTIQHHYAQVNGIRMHYVRAGAGERLVVLLHGFPQCWYTWRYQIPALAEHYTVIAPDLRGYNETEKPRWGYEMDGLVQDIAELVRVAGYERGTVVGHDWGGVIAWSLAIARPELVERLVTLNTPHPGRFGPGARMSPRQLLRSAYIVLFQIPAVPELVIRLGDYDMVEGFIRKDMVDRRRMSDDDMRFYRQALARPGALHAALTYYRRALLHTGGIFHGTGLHVRAPTMMIWGEPDRYFGSELIKGTGRFVPNLRVEMIPRCSHWVQEEAAPRVTELLLDFLP
jgi:pimeloyl-ACP methyl ester carboxylesterase